MNDRALGASFRDPSGYLFERDGVLLRRVNRSFAPDYDLLMSSGLYASLVDRGELVPHDEVEGSSADVHRVLRPERIEFVSYPYEWSFSQLRDAALLTLRVARSALDAGMVLKDASAYNVQFRHGTPVFIDTLSFERYRPGAPWGAYRQFCQHFLAPLALAAYRDVRLLQLLRIHLDGVPLDLARTLLPGRAWLNVHLFMHIWMQASYQARHEGATEKVEARPLQPKAFENLLTVLSSAVSKLRWRAEGTEWADYERGDSYTESAAEHKREVVRGFLERAAPLGVWDLGANTGTFSRLASDRGIPTVAWDVDPACVDRNYRHVRENRETALLPLLVDLANPSPDHGWAHEERDSLAARGPAGLVMALALIHHLAISNNVPLDRVAAFLARLSERLIVEFVPKSDPKVKILLANREDVFPDYTIEGFEAAFADRFETEQRVEVRDSERVLYLMKRRPGATWPP